MVMFSIGLLTGVLTAFSIIYLLEYKKRKLLIDYLKLKNKIEKKSKTPTTYCPDFYDDDYNGYTDWIAADFHWERGDID